MPQSRQPQRPQSRQPQRNAKPSDDLHEEGEYKDQHAPLRDPSEGKAPAVIGQDVAQYGGDFQDQGYAQEHVTIGVRGEPIEDGERDPDTIAEEQRMRADDMQTQGVHAWMAARDSRSEDELAASQFVAEEPRGTVVASGGGRAPNESSREGRRLPPVGQFPSGNFDNTRPSGNFGPPR